MTWPVGALETRMNMAVPSEAFHIIFIYLFAGKAVSAQITVMVKTGVRGGCSFLLLVPEDKNNNNCQ